MDFRHEKEKDKHINNKDNNNRRFRAFFASVLTVALACLSLLIMGCSSPEPAAAPLQGPPEEDASANAGAEEGAQMPPQVPQVPEQSAAEESNGDGMPPQVPTEATVEEDMNADEAATVSGSAATTNLPPALPDEEMKTFILTAVNFKFMMDGAQSPELRVQEGDRVRIEFSSTEGFHDWVVDDFGAATEQVRPGNSTSVEFVADKKGTFEYYCSIGSHRQQGMVGKLIVE